MHTNGVLPYQSWPLSKFQTPDIKTPREEFAALKDKINHLTRASENLVKRNDELERQARDAQRHEAKIWEAYSQEVKNLNHENHVLRTQLLEARKKCEELARPRTATTPVAETVSPIKPQDVEEMVAAATGADMDKLRSMCRRQELVRVRAIIYYLLREHTRLSLEDIGERYHRHHSSVIHSLRNLGDWMSVDKALAAEIAGFSERLKNNLA